MASERTHRPMTDEYMMILVSIKAITEDYYNIRHPISLCKVLGGVAWRRIFGESSECYGRAGIGVPRHA